MGTYESDEPVPALQRLGTRSVTLLSRQTVDRFRFFRYVSDLFLHTICQVRLSSIQPEFIVYVLRELGSVHGYLKEVVGSCPFLQERFSFEYLSKVSSKMLYRDLCHVVFPVPLHRTEYCAAPGQDVLNELREG